MPLIIIISVEASIEDSKIGQKFLCQYQLITFRNLNLNAYLILMVLDVLEMKKMFTLYYILLYNFYLRFLALLAFLVPSVIRELQKEGFPVT